ncbi:hypothetical protein ES703_28632 [subsurface metagenome]
MIHENKDEFIKALGRASKKGGFLLPLIEKDYYLTLILSRVYELSENLVFKGGTCLNKIYYSYYRLSEDLDFTMILPDKKTTRVAKRRTIKPVKALLSSYVNNYDMDVDGIENAGRNESSQYIFYITYNSVVVNSRQSIKIEIGLRYNPILPVEKQRINHKFLHPFTKEPLFDGGSVNCLSLKELVLENQYHRSLLEQLLYELLLL